MTPEYIKFMEDGTLPASMAARSKILDIARNYILSNKITSPTNIMPTQSYPHLDAMVALSRTERDQLLNQPPAKKPLPATLRAAAPVVAASRPVPSKPTPAQPNRYKDTSDSLLVKFACHEFTTAADRTEMQRELAARKITVQSNGRFTKSLGRSK